MKKIISFFMLIVLASCFMGHSASAAPCFDQETDFIQTTLSSLISMGGVGGRGEGTNDWYAISPDRFVFQ